MRIGLNLLHAMPEIGGGWNYIERLVAALGLGDDTINTYICFVTSKSSSLVPERKNFRPVFVNINPVSRAKRILYENTMLQLSAISHRIDLMHWFANTMPLISFVPGVVTLYDLLFFDSPDRFSLIQRLYLQRMTMHAVKKASCLLPMSQYTAQRLQSILNVNNDRVVVIPAIVDHKFHPADNEVVIKFRRKFNLSEKFWLYVAHFYPHKNHKRLIEAYYLLIKHGMVPWPLVLRGDDHGALTELKRFITERGISDHVIFLPRLEEIDLPVLYTAAGALVFPSLYEGGGIPVLEAMACGCPVVASNIPTTQEFGSNAVLMFDPLTIESISETMHTFQNDDSLRMKFRELGLNQVHSHRPEQIYITLNNVYKKIKSNMILNHRDRDK